MYVVNALQENDTITVTCIDNRPNRQARDRDDFLGNAVRFARAVALWCMQFGVRLGAVITINVGRPFRDVNGNVAVTCTDASIRAGQIRDEVRRTFERAGQPTHEALGETTWLAFDLTGWDVTVVHAVLGEWLPGWFKILGPRTETGTAVELRTPERVPYTLLAVSRLANYDVTEPELTPPERLPTPASVRELLQRVLRSAEDFDAFCYDWFQDTHTKFSGGMDRVARTTLLFQRVGYVKVLGVLRRQYPEPVTDHEEVLRYA